MTVETINQIKIHSAKFRLIQWVILGIVGITLECIFRETLYETGISIIHELQDKINENLFAISLLQFISLLSTKYIIISCSVLFFNYFDMYTTLVFIVVSASGSIGTGFFKLIYKNPRPFFHEEWVKVYDCETGYGNPSGHSIIAVSVYLTLWKILRKKVPFAEKHKKKLFIFVFIFICSILISRLALGAHSLNQILLGSFIGYETYLLFFYVIKIDLKLHEEVKVLMKISNLKLFATIVSIILIAGILIFNLFPLKITLDVSKYLERILEQCPGTPYSKVFDYEAYFMLAACSSLIGAYYGIYYDIQYNLKNSQDKWIKMNFGFYQWNKTSFYKSIGRLLLILFVLSGPFSLTVLISSEAHTNYIFILKNLIPYFLINFMLFALCRHLSVVFKIANENSAVLEE